MPDEWFKVGFVVGCDAEDLPRFVDELRRLLMTAEGEFEATIHSLTIDSLAVRPAVEIEANPDEV